MLKMTRYFKETLMILMVILSRLPFIFNSLGSDLDAWREVYTGKALHTDHIYNVSRFPGYPLSEITYSFIYDWPYWSINLLSVLFTAGCCLYFLKILEFFKIKSSFFISFVFSFIPIIYVNSTVAMEYNWSLFFLLGSLYHLLNRKLWIPTLFLGLMVSARFNNIIFLPAFTFLAYHQFGRKIKKTVQFSVLSVVFICLCFSPVILKYGAGFLQSSGASEVSFPTLLSLGTLHVYGILGFISIFLALIVQFFMGGYQSMKESYKNPFMTFCIIMIALNLAFFMKYPLEAGYLIPSIPFVLILLQHILNEKLMKFVLISLFLSPFLIHMNATKVQLKGLIFVNEDYEDQELEYCKNLVAKIKLLSKNGQAIFHMGNYSEQVMLMGKFHAEDSTKIVKSLSKADEDAILNQGYQLYYINTVDGSIENNQTHMLDQHGILLQEDFELRK